MEVKFDFLKPTVIFCIHLRNRVAPSNITVSDTNSGEKSTSIKRLGNSNWYSVGMKVYEVPKTISYNNLTLKTFPYQPKPKICHKCMKPNHTVATCKAKKPTCAKCTEQHWTKECKLTKPILCANCGSQNNHSALSQLCPKINKHNCISNSPPTYNSKMNAKTSEDKKEQIIIENETTETVSTIVNTTSSISQENSNSQKISELEQTIKELKDSNIVLLKDKADKDTKIEHLMKKISELSAIITKISEHVEEQNKSRDKQSKGTEHVPPTVPEAETKIQNNNTISNANGEPFIRTDESQFALTHKPLVIDKNNKTKVNDNMSTEQRVKDKTIMTSVKESANNLKQENNDNKKATKTTLSNKQQCEEQGPTKTKLSQQVGETVLTRIENAKAKKTTKTFIKSPIVTRSRTSAHKKINKT